MIGPAPLPQDILAAACNPQFVKDPFFDGLSAKKIAGGRAESFGGANSIVFPILKGGKKWAFKVWYNELPSNKERHEAIIEHLKKCNLSYFVETIFVPDGLLVPTGYIDTLRMEWVEGVTLVDYIQEHLEEPIILESLANEFLQMMRDLRENNISHGDLHHKNIIVNATGKLQLVDYDSICVPELNGKPDICRGHPCFQHPLRQIARSIASLKMDYFSELVIYLSIIAVAENRLLWGKYKVMEAERLLFSFKDFGNFEESDIKKDLSFLSDRINDHVEIMENYIAAHLSLNPFYT